MSDPSVVLRPALRSWLKADTEVVAAFGAKEVKVFAKRVPPNTVPPYLSISFFIVHDTADCYDGALVETSFAAWSAPTPADNEEAGRIIAAVQASVARAAASGNSPAFTMAGFRLVESQPLSTQEIEQPDGKTVQALHRALLSIDPL